MNKYKILGNRIKSLRKEKELSQTELAELTGLSNKSSISSYESGRSSPPDDIKLKMCEIFNCSMDYLLGITDIRNDNNNLNDSKDLFISVYDSDKIDDADKELLLNMYYNMIKNKKKE